MHRTGMMQTLSSQLARLRRRPLQLYLSLQRHRLLRLALEGRVQDAADASPKALVRCFAEGDAQSRLQVLIGGRDPEATLH